MRANKLIKAFIPYTINAEFAAWCGKAVRSAAKAAEAVQHFIAKDPDDHEWSSIGLVDALEQGALVHDLDGAAYLLMYQWAERKLPASVRDEKVNERYKELSIQEGRPLNKKEFAQLREDVESSLLPQAFIVRKYTPVLVTKDTLLICTSSASMAEKILGQLVRMCEVRKVKLEFGGHEFPMSYGALLGQVARDGWLQLDDDQDAVIHAGQSAKFKGEDKRTITVKDRDLASDELKQVTQNTAYAVTELRMHLEINGGEAVSEFTMTDKFIIKGFKLSDFSMAGIDDRDKDDMHATYWLLAKELLRTLGVLSAAMGEEPADATTTDDEEL